MRAYFVAGLVCLLVSGCVTTPQFETLSGVTPKTIVDVIECELIEARQKIRDANKNTADKKKRPTLDEWTAVADLTLQVDEEASLAPAFTHTDVVSKSLTRVFDWGVKFNTQATRIYTETVTFKIADLKTCRRPPTKLSLNGNLGLQEVIDMAFGAIDQDDVGIGHPGDPGTAPTRRARVPTVSLFREGLRAQQKRERESGREGQERECLQHLDRVRGGEIPRPDGPVVEPVQFPGTGEVVFGRARRRAQAQDLLCQRP